MVALRLRCSPTAACASTCQAVGNLGREASRTTACLIDEDENCILSFTASATPDMPVRVIMGEAAAPPGLRSSRARRRSPASRRPSTTRSRRTSRSRPTAPRQGRLAFHLGKAAAYEFCISDVSLTTSATPPPGYEPDTGPRVRSNQVGYLPFGPEARDARDGRSGQPRSRGSARRRRRGRRRRHERAARRRAVGEQAVHVIDFSDVTVEGEGFTLVADGEIADHSSSTSRPTSTSSSRYDAYFYLARSGADPGRRRRGTPARPGTSASRPTRATRTSLPRAARYYDGWTGRDYQARRERRLVRRGRPGKYVVNGGIAVGPETRSDVRACAARRHGRPTARSTCPSTATTCPTCSTRRAGARSGCSR